MPQMTRPQVYRVVREMLPRPEWPPAALWGWLMATQQRNERAKRAHLKRRAARRSLVGAGQSLQVCAP